MTPKVPRLNATGVKQSNRGFTSFKWKLIKVEEEVIFFLPIQNNDN